MVVRARHGERRRERQHELDVGVAAARSSGRLRAARVLGRGEQSSELTRYDDDGATSSSGRMTTTSRHVQRWRSSGMRPPATTSPAPVDGDATSTTTMTNTSAGRGDSATPSASSAAGRHEARRAAVLAGTTRHGQPAIGPCLGWGLGTPAL